MSWFTELAGKAEDFLNKVDQGAATALSKNQERTSSFSSPYEEEPAVPNEYNSAAYKTEPAVTHHAHPSSRDAPIYISAVAGNIKKSSATLLAGTANVPSTPSGSGTSNSSSGVSNPAKTSAGFVRPKKSEQDVDDDMLFDFLNSSDPPDSSRRDSKREIGKAAAPVMEVQSPTPPPSFTPHNNLSASSTPPSTRGVSRASSMSSLSAHSIKTSEDNSAKEQSQDTPESSDSGLAPPQESSRPESSRPEPTVPTEEPQSQVLSRLRLENQLLRNEVASLNQEMASVIQRAKDLQDEAERQTLAETVTAAERRAVEEKLRVDDLQQQVKSAKAAAESAKQELQDYKHKAARILQCLENLLVTGRRSCSTLRMSTIGPKSTCRAESKTEKMKSKNSGISNSSQTELENRLHQLTETLIQKQTMLEALGTEKSSLVFQLERLEQQLKNTQGGQSGGQVINMSPLEGPG
ncbi:hypothetical protein GOODEAATRI_022911 [Goodea atripinnis]|uniref:Golgin subfamily A member 5 n=1 Tax=Goodea atripinnis TaxID=208336 RepID=A0ABV0MK19_9TELE